MLRLHRIAAPAIVLVLIVTACAGPGATTPPTSAPTAPPTAPLTLPPTAAPSIAPSPPATPEPTTQPTPAPTPTPTPTAAPTRSPQPTPRPTPTEPPSTAEACIDGAWLGFFGYGITCLDDAGWHTFTEETSDLPSDQVEDLASCADGRTWVATTFGLVVGDGRRWENMDHRLDGRHPSSIACDPDGGVWLGGFRFVGHLTDEGATWHDPNDLGTGEFVEQIKDVAVASDGTAWAITPNSVARFDGRAWRFWESGADFPETVYFDAIAVDADGTPWAAFGNGVYTLVATTWESHTGRNLSTVQAVMVDGKGRIWAGTYAQGVSVWNGSTWSIFSRQSGHLPSDHVRAMAADTSGRIWIGTEYGLAVYDGKTWRAYQMHTSGLAENEVWAVSVSGAGPSLPAHEKKPTGVLIGRVTRAGEPLAGATVEVCVEFIGFSYSGDTPCSGQPFTKATTTSASGAFIFKGVPTGRYAVTLETPEGKWLKVTDQFSVGVKKATVLPSQTTDLGELELTED